MSITLSDSELQALTGYKSATKRLNVLHNRGFLRAYIDRNGFVVLERAHYEAVSRGELHHAVNRLGGKVANLNFPQRA